MLTNRITTTCNDMPIERVTERICKYLGEDVIMLLPKLPEYYNHRWYKDSVKLAIEANYINIRGIREWDFGMYTCMCSGRDDTRYNYDFILAQKFAQHFPMICPYSRYQYPHPTVYNVVPQFDQGSYCYCVVPSPSYQFFYY